jgi:hypothetical protein
MTTRSISLEYTTSYGTVRTISSKRSTLQPAVVTAAYQGREVYWDEPTRTGPSTWT